MDPRTGLPKTKNTYNFGTAYDINALNHPGVDYTNVLPGLPPGQINYGGFTPNYRDLIEHDSGFQAAVDALNPAGIGNAAQRDAAFRRAYVTAGLPIDFASTASSLGLSPTDTSGIFDPATQQLAQENTQAGLSTEARLSQAHLDAIRNIKNSLAARGALHSGEAGYQLGRENQNYAQGEYDAKTRLLDYLASYQQGYVQAEQQRQAQLAQAASDAANRQSQLAQNQPTQGATAVFDSFAPDGSPLYRGPDGSLHNQDGTIYSPPPPQDFSGASFGGAFRPPHGGGPNARFV